MLGGRSRICISFRECLMKSPEVNTVLLPELDAFRKEAVSRKEDAERRNDNYGIAKATELIEMLDRLGTFVTVSQRCRRDRWLVIKGYIETAITHPYPQFVPIYEMEIANLLLQSER
jgi:hypothetical protein